MLIKSVTTTLIIAISLLFSATAAGQTTMSIQNFVQSQGLTGYTVRAIPDGFEASEREWLQLMAADPSVQEAMRNAVVDSIKDRASVLTS